MVNNFLITPLLRQINNPSLYKSTADFFLKYFFVAGHMIIK